MSSDVILCNKTGNSYLLSTCEILYGLPELREKKTPDMILYRVWLTFVFSRLLAPYFASLITCSYDNIMSAVSI